MVQGDQTIWDQNVEMLNFDPRPHLLFHQMRTNLGWGWGVATPVPSAPECDRALWQKPADSLGRFQSNGVRVDLFRSTVDLPGQVKQKMYHFPDINCVQFFVNNFFPIWDRALILPPSSFSRHGGTTHILCDTERSLGNFDLRSAKVKVTDWPK